MDESPNGRDIVSVMGDVLHTLNQAGYEIRRVAPPGAVSASHDRFEELVTDNQLQQTSGPLFRDSHYARAVEEAFKCLNNAVKDKSGIAQQDGAGLMRAVFSANSPVLKFRESESQSARDEQQGYMDIFAGSMTGIRNPRAHDHELTDGPDVALELLVLANHLMRKLNAATKNEPQTTDR